MSDEPMTPREMFMGLGAEIRAMRTDLGGQIGHLREDHERMRDKVGDLNESVGKLFDRVADARERLSRIDGERAIEVKDRPFAAAAHEPIEGRAGLRRFGVWVAIAAAAVTVLGGFSSAADHVAKWMTAIAHAAGPP